MEAEKKLAGKPRKNKKVIHPPIQGKHGETKYDVSDPALLKDSSFQKLSDLGNLEIEEPMSGLSDEQAKQVKATKDAAVVKARLRKLVAPPSPPAEAVTPPLLSVRDEKLTHNLVINTLAEWKGEWTAWLSTHDPKISPVSDPTSYRRVVLDLNTQEREWVGKFRGLLEQLDHVYGQVSAHLETLTEEEALASRNKRLAALEMKVSNTEGIPVLGEYRRLAGVEK